MSRQEDFIEAGIAYRMEHGKPMCIAGNMLHCEHFSYADDVCIFVNEVLKGDYETITEGIDGYTVWYKTED